MVQGEKRRADMIGTRRAGRRRRLVRQGDAQFLDRASTDTRRVALTGTSDLDDLFGNDLRDWIVSICQPKQLQGRILGLRHPRDILGRKCRFPQQPLQRHATPQSPQTIMRKRLNRSCRQTAAVAVG